MEILLRGATIYFVLYLLMRLSGNRQFAQMTAFDGVLLILIAEVTGQALIGEDYSVTGALLIIGTIIGLDILISLVKRRWKAGDKVVEGVPILLVDEGNLIGQNLAKERVEKEDILEAAREKHGLERLEDIQYAILERDGNISIVPRGRASG